MLRKEPPRSSFDSPKEAESLCGISSFDSPKEAALRASALRASPEDFARSSFDSLPPPLSVDEALERAGGWSVYQRRLMLWVGLGTATCAVHMLQPIFLLPLIDWDLTATERGLMTTCFFAGYALGVLPWATLSDRRGRRPTIIVALLIAQVGGVGSFLAPSLGPFLVLRCVCGFGIAGAKNALFLLATEYAPPAARAQVRVRVRIRIRVRIRVRVRVRLRSAPVRRPRCRARRVRGPCRSA